MERVGDRDRLRQQSLHPEHQLSPPEMFHQAWAALLYLYGLVFNSTYQCSEHGQLTALGVDETQVRTEAHGERRGRSRKSWVGSSGRPEGMLGREGGRGVEGKRRESLVAHYKRAKASTLAR